MSEKNDRRNPVAEVAGAAWALLFLVLPVALIVALVRWMLGL